jgi:hypothetical protein
LVAGGGDDRLPLRERILDSAEVYNPATTTWTATRPMTVDRLNHLAVLLSNRKVLADGGTVQALTRVGGSSTAIPAGPPGRPARRS